MTNTSDPRYRNTEKAIRSAYYALIADNGTDGITATKICEAADISRNAFYLHHSSVVALQETLVDEVISDIWDKCSASSTRVKESGAFDATLTSEIMDALSSHEPMLRAVLPSDHGALACRLASALTDIYIGAGRMFGEHGSSTEHKMACAYAAWGLIGQLMRWLSETDRPITDIFPFFDAAQFALANSATDFLLKKDRQPASLN